MIHVLIVDDHQLIRQGLVVLLEKAKDIQVVGEARDGQEAIDQAVQLCPDVILMDIEMPRLDGLKATSRLQVSCPSAKVLMLSMRSDDKVVRQALQNGASGYLVKNSSREELVSAIREVYNGGSPISPSVAAYS